MLLVDQVAIITGGASGIGRAASRLFAEEGATVILMDRSESGIIVADEIRKAGRKATFIQIDIRDREHYIIIYRRSSLNLGRSTFYSAMPVLIHI